MSDFVFTCPRCKQLLKGSDSLVGQVVECTSCNAEITLHSRNMQTVAPPGSSAQSPVPDTTITQADFAAPRQSAPPAPERPAPRPQPQPATSARASGRKDLKPRVERNQTNGVSQAEVVRDQIYALFEKAAAERGVEVQLLKSPPFTAVPWVHVDVWIRHASDPALTLRSSAEISIRPCEFCRFPVEMDLAICDDKRRRNWSSIVVFDASDANDVLSYLLYERKSHSFVFRRRRTHPLQFWRPSNRPTRLGVDYLTAVQVPLYIVGFFTISLAGAGLLLLIVAGVLTYVGRRRRMHVLSTGRPVQEPRNLIRLDSWQTVVRGLGQEQPAVYEAVKSQVAACMEGGVTVGGERIWYLGIDGKEERTQLVARFNRAIAFIHVYRYGDDLYVGWDAHVNAGTWTEQTTRIGFDKNTSELCTVNTIRSDWHVPTEYDVTDANCLLESVHAMVAKVVKLKLAEHHIDQEIDFHILREERQGIAGRQDSAAPALKRSIRSALSKFKRIG